MSITLALVLIFAPYVLFTVWYGATRAWWKSWEGRGLFISGVAWTLVSGGFLLDNWRNVPNWAWAAIGLIAAASGFIKLGLIAVDSCKRRRADR